MWNRKGLSRLRKRTRKEPMLPWRKIKLRSGWTNQRLEGEKGVRIKPLKVGFFGKNRKTVVLKGNRSRRQDTKTRYTVEINTRQVVFGLLGMFWIGRIMHHHKLPKTQWLGRFLLMFFKVGPYFWRAQQVSRRPGEETLCQHYKRQTVCHQNFHWKMLLINKNRFIRWRIDSSCSFCWEFRISIDIIICKVLICNKLYFLFWKDDACHLIFLQ